MEFANTYLLFETINYIYLQNVCIVVGMGSYSAYIIYTLEIV